MRYDDLRKPTRTTRQSGRRTIPTTLRWAGNKLTSKLFWLIVGWSVLFFATRGHGYLTLAVIGIALILARIGIALFLDGEELAGKLGINHWLVSYLIIPMLGALLALSAWPIIWWAITSLDLDIEQLRRIFGL